MEMRALRCFQAVAEFGSLSRGAEFLRVSQPAVSRHIHEWLVRGQVDLACVHDPLPQRGFTATPLVREEVYLVGKPGGAPFRRGHARTADLAELPLVLPGRPNASRRLLDGRTAEGG